MTLLYFTIQMDQLGGVARIEADKVNWLAAHGYDVVVCDIEDWDMKPYYPLDERVKFVVGHLPTTPGGILTRSHDIWQSIKKVKLIIKDVNPDIIINAHCPLVTWILPFVSHGIPTITEMHQSRQGLEVFNRWAMSKWTAWGHKHLIRWIYSRYSRFVTLTNGDKESWNLSNCICIPNFSSIDSVSHPDVEYKQVVMLARLMPQKRIDLMIKVWERLASRFPDWKIKVLGDGLERDNLQQMIDNANLTDSFILAGAVKDVRSELASSDILCLTSEYEGFGIVLIEAMNMGVPVMAMEYVGVHDIINDGVDGYIVKFGDVDAYADKLATLITSREERKRLADNAYQSVHKFDREVVMNKWCKLFSDLTKCV